MRAGHGDGVSCRMDASTAGVRYVGSSCEAERERAGGRSALGPRPARACRCVGRICSLGANAVVRTGFMPLQRANDAELYYEVRGMGLRFC